MLALLATAVLTDFVPRRRQPLTTRSLFLCLLTLLAMLLICLVLVVVVALLILERFDRHSAQIGVTLLPTQMLQH